MKTLLISITFVMALSAVGGAQQLDRKGNILGVCQFSSVGWVKTFGKDMVEFTQTVKGHSSMDLKKACNNIANAFALAHPEQGDMAFVWIKALPNKALTKNETNTMKLASRSMPLKTLP